MGKYTITNCYHIIEYAVVVTICDGIHRLGEHDVQLNEIYGDGEFNG